MAASRPCPDRERSPMKRSTDRILTTHAGSLPRPADLTRMMWGPSGREAGGRGQAACAGARGGGRRRPQAARRRHRHRLGRRDEQGRLQQLRDAALFRLRQSRPVRCHRPRRVSGDHQQAVRRERGRAASGDAERGGSDRAARRWRRAARHRQPQGGARRRVAGRRVHRRGDAGADAVQFSQPLLSLGTSSSRTSSIPC